MWFVGRWVLCGKVVILSPRNRYADSPGPRWAKVSSKRQNVQEIQSFCEHIISQMPKELDKKSWAQKSKKCLWPYLRNESCTWKTHFWNMWGQAFVERIYFFCNYFSSQFQLKSGTKCVYVKWIWSKILANRIKTWKHSHPTQTFLPWGRFLFSYCPTYIPLPRSNMRQKEKIGIEWNENAWQIR